MCKEYENKEQIIGGDRLIDLAKNQKRVVAQIKTLVDLIEDLTEESKFLESEIMEERTKISNSFLEIVDNDVEKELNK